MSGIIDVTNKSACLYQEAVIPQVIKICEPLTKNLGISKFGYSKLFKDSSFLFLMNGFREYISKYLTIIVPQEIIHMEVSDEYSKSRQGYIFWPVESISQDMFLSLNYEFNIWHGFTIYYKTQDYLEKFSFAFDKNSGEKMNFYINNLFLLESFCSYFRTAAKDIIDCSDKSRLAIFQNGIQQTLFLREEDIIQSANSKFLNFLQMHQLNKLAGIKFSKREFECIKSLAHGKTTKEIAQRLNLSPRTIASYIENIKNKTGYSFKSQIVDLFWNNIHIQPKSQNIGL